MVQVVSGGSREFNMLLGGEPHPNTVQYLRNQMSQLGSNAAFAASTWFNNVRESYDRFASDTALRIARTAISSVKSYFQGNVIRPLRSVSELQQAPVVMQRYLMANPVVREMYHDNRCDGYSQTYIDMEPKAIGEDHYDYRRVMNGIVTDLPVSEEDPEGSWKVSVYMDELKEGDRELILIDQDIIISCWERQRMSLAVLMDDTTSQTGGSL